MTRDAGAARLIALDWGTSSLRALLLGADGAVLDRRAEKLGIMQVAPGGFPDAFARVAGEWRAAHPGLPAIASGMVGSAQGWREAPYARGAAGLPEMAAGLVVVETGDGGRLHIVPGLAQGEPAPDVMRGEETQVLGALALRPELGDARLLLPGTHSKWVDLSAGRIVAFRTFMTGELFAVLRAHSILGRLAPDGADDSAFLDGVAAARASGEGVAPLLFSARARALLGLMPAAASLGYLSGLLIGDELRAAAADPARPLALIGDSALCARYARALGVFGVREVPEIEGAAEAGLWRIATAAGLVDGGERAR